MSEQALTDSELESWRMAFREQRSARGSDCPDEESLVRLVLGEIHGTDRDRLANHFVQCRACGRDWQLLRQVHAEARQELARVRPRWRAGLAVAAGLAAIGLGAFLILQPELDSRTALTQEPTEVTRGTDDTDLSTAVTPSDGQDLAVPPASLSWPQSASSSGTFRVTVFNANLTPIWQSGPVQEAKVMLPEDVRARMAPGQVFLWSVEPQGSEKSMLGPFKFQILAGGK
jgi:hypothetical protein